MNDTELAEKLQGAQDELRAAARQRAAVRVRLGAVRLTALRTIASLPPDRVHLAPEIAQRALKQSGPREPS